MFVLFVEGRERIVSYILRRSSVGRRGKSLNIESVDVGALMDVEFVDVLSMLAADIGYHELLQLKWRERGRMRAKRV